MKAGVRRESRFYWVATYDSDDEGLGTQTEHLTRWGARRAARRWLKRMANPPQVEWLR